MATVKAKELIANVHRPPHNRRESKSRPNRSVPKRLLGLGGESERVVSTTQGPAGANTGARIALPVTKVNQLSVAKAMGRRQKGRGVGDDQAIMPVPLSDMA
jgi:hypothetical protein